MMKADLCRNARIGFCIGENMKRFYSFVLCLAFMLALSSCGETESILPEEKIVAVEYGLEGSIESESFFVDGFSIATYNTPSDVVLAVENGKATFGVLDDFQFNSYISAGRKIKNVALCGYRIEYCACFASDNEALQEKFNAAIHLLNKDGTLEKIKSDNLKNVAYEPIESIKSNETLVMLCDPSFPNRLYLNDNNDAVGLDIDIAKAICNYLGYELEIRTADFDDLFTMLQEGEGDFVISAAEVSEIKAEQFLLSDTYFTLNYHLIEKE